MVAAVRVHQTGGPEMLRYEDVPVKEPGQGEIKLKQTAIGLNYIDTYFRTGLYPAQLPFIAGNEGAGVVTAVGPGVKGIKKGDRVAYVVTLGAYAAERVLPAERAVKIPPKIDDKTAAAMMLKGMTAQYLLRRTYKVKKGDTILVHAAAGGVGLILCQWGKALGATVIGTAGSQQKAELAQKNGAHHVILYNDENWVARVGEITKGKKCDVVYDGVGKTTFMGSLDCLRPLGHDGDLRQRLGAGRSRQSRYPVAKGLAVRDAADADDLHRERQGLAGDGEGPDRRHLEEKGEDRGQPDLLAPRRAAGAPRPRIAQDHRADGAHSLNAFIMPLVFFYPPPCGEDRRASLRARQGGGHSENATPPRRLGTSSFAVDPPHRGEGKNFKPGNDG